MADENGHYRIRMTAATLEALRQPWRRDSRSEHFAFATAKLSAAHDSHVLCIDQIIVPDLGDLAVQSRYRIAPNRTFQSAIYTVALQRNATIVDIHTHAHAGPVTFSAIDRREMQRNAQYIASRFPAPMTFAAVVMDQNGEHFDAAIFDRDSSTFRAVERLDIVGKPQRHLASTSHTTVPISDAERYSRQMLLPGWSQTRLADLRVAIVGLGGNGAQVLAALTSMGVGETGWIAAFDPDVLERSNLPRIPYATAEDCGRTKCAVAAEYVRRRHPRTRFFPSVRAVEGTDIPNELKVADVIFSCVDSDRARLVLNEISIRFGSSLIDLGCDVRIVNERTIAGGQVRTIIPGASACLVCCGGLDCVEIAKEEIPAASRKLYAQRGYMIGSVSDATPSVASLNGVTAHFAIGALLALSDLEPVRAHDFIGLDWSAGTIVTATTIPRSNCPVCGENGVLLQGNPLSPAEPMHDEPSNEEAPAWAPMLDQPVNHGSQK